MLKVYNYKPEDMGMTEFAPGTLRLVADFVKQVDDPGKADVFVVPPSIHCIKDWNALKFLSGREDRHVVFSGGDFMHLDTPTNTIAFRMDCHKNLMERNPWSIAWPWPTPQEATKWRNTQVPKHDVFFHGWVSSALCKKALDILSDLNRRALLSTDFRRDNRFYGYLQKEEQDQLIEPFYTGMSQARLSLSIRSIPVGVIRYRYYEAMSMGRCSIHVNDGCVYPLHDRIDYEVFTLRIAESGINQIGQYVMEYLTEYSDLDLYKRGEYAAEMWDRWLDSSKWPQTMAEIVQEKVS